MGRIEKIIESILVTGCLIGVANAQSVLTDKTADDKLGRQPIASRRIVKHFDFDEERFGNLDTLPMYWRKHIDKGFPRYLEGEFDRNTGHTAPPSFLLKLDGSSLAYHYMGPEGRDIAVSPNSDYLVTAYIKTDSLSSARAYISAYYLDRKGNPIPGTERRSKFIGSPEQSTDFEQVTVGLQGNVQGARYVGISLWLTQARIWDSRHKPMRHIERIDVDAKAWFDDITVYRLPRVVLKTTTPGNVFAHDEDVVLYSEVSDPDDRKLEAKFTLRSADGRLIDQRPIQIQTGMTTKTNSIRYDDLDYGIYHAEMLVTSDSNILVQQSLRFVRLAQSISSPATAGRGFGVVLNHRDSTLLDGQKRLLEYLRPEFVKLPVWDAQKAIMTQTTIDENLDHYLEAIQAARSDPIGIIRDVPLGKNFSDPSGTHSMVDIFTEDPLNWKPLIANVWARYLGLIRVWQLGSDGNESVFLDHRYPTLLPTLEREMKELTNKPLLATTSTVRYSPDDPHPGHFRAVTLPEDTPPHDIERHI